MTSASAGRTQIAPANDFEIEVALVEADGTVIVRKMIAGGTLAAIPLPLEGRLFDQGVSLRAFIKTFRGATIYRASCANRPKYCSSGDLTLIISSSDTTKRVGEVARQFAGFSADAVPAERIRTPAEVRKAVGFMERSVCLHRLSLKTAAPGTNYSSAVCRTEGR